MKDTPIEIKNNLQGNNSSVNKAENQFNNWEHKEAKNNQLEQHEEKIFLKNEDSINSLRDNFKQSTFASQGCQKEKRKQQISSWKSI